MRQFLAAPNGEGKREVRLRKPRAVTNRMAADVTDRLWGISDIVKALQVRESTS